MKKSTSGPTSTSIVSTQLKPDLSENYDRAVPHIIKYMGSKRSILDFVIEAVNDLYTSGRICDLFAGTSVLSGALGKVVPMHSNDIQEYSSVLSHTYLSNYTWTDYGDDILEKIVEAAKTYVDHVKKSYPALVFPYLERMTIANFVQMEERQKTLMTADFSPLSHHLFTQYYSGTYWSFDQCVWIDALRKVADSYKGTPVYYAVLSSLMYSMSYCSQSTGHYAQYRDAKNKSSKDDILLYRLREIEPYFRTKFKQLQKHLSANVLQHQVTSLDYRTCLDQLDAGTLVYADPPYAFVHYSRFYHALETLVKYDYPDVAHKGRYRLDRHQSPFSRQGEVVEAFKSLFTKIMKKRSSLILSYSNTGMITLDNILSLAADVMGDQYEITYREVAYKHSTMGRSDDKNKDVKEYLVISKFITR